MTDDTASPPPRCISPLRMTITSPPKTSSRTFSSPFGSGSLIAPLIYSVPLTYICIARALFRGLGRRASAPSALPSLPLLPPPSPAGPNDPPQTSALSQIQHLSHRSLERRRGGSFSRSSLLGSFFPGSAKFCKILVFGCLAWHVLFPIAAGFWLCYRGGFYVTNRAQEITFGAEYKEERDPWCLGGFVNTNQRVIRNSDQYAAGLRQ